ncbi:hypothetical protein B0O99DRAFT_607148 [Bisporella sp. PMI_857]|nr:hypothetical protein B0O99DRAFT_607148 [Bisporella sp. PMI_857]
MNSTILRRSAILVRSPAAQRRAFSMGTSFRSALDSAKAQIFERNSMVKDHAPADWSRVRRHATGAAVFYFPWMFGFLAWPLAAEYAIKGNM